ncbi:MAG: hypothetical protein IKS02_08115 [Fibrobacter sp.]|nr:hypothetical protein [Fibrobacter sp.]
MKKLLSIQEIKQSPWPSRFTETFGDNLVSAFLYGDCLEEGFSALEAPWTVAFILKDASTVEVHKLKSWSKTAKREGLVFTYVFSSAEILSNLDLFPLEFLEMSRRSRVLCGISPLEGFSPNRESLIVQCLREWKAFLFHSRLSFTGSSELQELSPLLSGLYYLKNGSYPESRRQVLDAFPELRSTENLLESLQKVFDQVCSTPNH